MEQKFKDFLLEHKLLLPEQSCLLAVSGGVDSMVMASLFLKLKLCFSVAHCNFSLRGAESDGDEALVRDWALSNGVHFYSNTFDTLFESEHRKLSIQETARVLRYEWLDGLRQTLNFNTLATAHHLNDSIETVLFNLTRGTGIRGLTGIPMVNGCIIRPLLFATREEIEAYAKENIIPYRNDTSNDTDKYARNKIRHQVVDTLKTIHPNLETTLGSTIEILRETNDLFQYAVTEIKEKITTKTENSLSISISELKNYPSNKTLLYEILAPFQFTQHQLPWILKAGEGQSGKKFFSPSHVLLVNRDSYLVEPRTTLEEHSFELYEDSGQVSLHEGVFTIEKLQHAPNSWGKNPNSTYIQGDEIEFPLVIRKWEEGDYFLPLGMEGQRQKLQDYFTHKKLSTFEKSKVWIVTSGKKVVWVVGYRLDHRFRVQNEKQNCWKLSYTGHR